MSPHPRSLLAAGLLLAAGSAFAEPGARDPFAPATAGDPIRLAQAPGVMGHFLDGAEDERDQGGGDTGGDDDGNTGGDDGGGGEVIGGGDGSGLTDWEDPTQLEYYKDYPAEEPRPDTLTDSLASIAASMQPGEWRQLPDAKYQGEAMWADKAQWDPARKRVSYVGHNGIPERPTRWVMWDVDDRYWYRQVGDEFHPKAGIHHRWGFRSYGKYAQLSDGSNIYSRFDRLWKQDPETLEWSAWTMHPCYETISNIEYFPEMGAVVSLGKGEKFCAYEVEKGQWLSLPRPAVDGYHSMMRYNPVRGEMLLIGGNDSWRTAQILRPDGTLRRMADAPRNTRIMRDQLSVDPVSGHYLLMTWEPDEQRGVSDMDVEFFGFNAETNEWYLIDRWQRTPNWKGGDAWPFSSEHAAPVTVPIPEYGVTMWIESMEPGVHLYKHDAP